VVLIVCPYLSSELFLTRSLFGILQTLQSINLGGNEGASFDQIADGIFGRFPP
jgi:hypothetical protein